MRNLKTDSLNSILKHAQVPTSLLLQIFEFNPSNEWANELLEKKLDWSELIRVWQIWKNVIADSNDFWEKASTKIDFNRIEPSTLLVLCNEAQSIPLWIKVILTGKFDASTYLEFIIESGSPLVMKTIISQNLIDFETLIEMLKNTKNTYWETRFSETLFRYFELERTIDIDTSEWHTSLIKIAILLDTSEFWENVAEEISNNNTR